MKTISIKKRVALVAASALAIGGFGASAAFADGTATTATGVTLAAGQLNCYTSTTGASTTVLLSGGTITAVPNAAYSTTGTTVVADTLVVTGPFAFSAAGGSNTLSSATKVTGASGGSTASTIVSTGLGSGTISFYSQGSALVATANITAVASCDSGVSAANSYTQVSDTAGHIATAANLAAGSGAATVNTTALDNSVDVATSYAVGSTAYLEVYPRDVYKNKVGTSSYISVTATNGAVVAGVAGGNILAVPGSTTNGEFSIAAPTYGTPISTVVTVSIGATVIATKNITFAGDAVSLKASYAVSGVAGTSATTAYVDTTHYTNGITYRVYDSVGNQVKDTASAWTVKLDSSDNSALVNTIAVDRTNESQAGKGGIITYNCINGTKSGTASLVLALTNKAGVKVSSAPLKVACSASVIDTFSIALDKKTYQTGDIATLTITAKDANGAPVSDATPLGAGAAVVVSGMTPVLAPATADVPNGATAGSGTWTYTYAVGTTTGNYVASVQLPTAVTTLTPQTLQAIITGGSTSDIQALVKVVGTLLTTFTKQIAALIKALGKK